MPPAIPPIALWDSWAAGVVVGVEVGDSVDDIPLAESLEIDWI